MPTILNTKAKKLTAGVASLLLSYIFISLAIDSGSILQYFLTLIFLVSGIKLLIHSIRTHGNK